METTWYRVERAQNSYSVLCPPNPVSDRAHTNSGLPFGHFRFSDQASFPEAAPSGDVKIALRVVLWPREGAPRESVPALTASMLKTHLASASLS